MSSENRSIRPADLSRAMPTATREAIELMWLRSATFRRQCLRLAAAERVIVKLRVDPGLTGRSYRARTDLSFAGGRAVAADIVLPAWGDHAELLAHELEHVLEQIDHVDLARHVGAGVVWRRPDGGFETARAIEAGRRVAEEVRSGTRLARILP